MGWAVAWAVAVVFNFPELKFAEVLLEAEAELELELVEDGDGDSTAAEQGVCMRRLGMSGVCERNSLNHSGTSYGRRRRACLIRLLLGGVLICSSRPPLPLQPPQEHPYRQGHPEP